MDAARVSVRAIPADLLLLESAVICTGIPEEDVMAAFWWEYLRSSPAAVQAVERTCRPGGGDWNDSSVAQIVGFGAAETLGMWQDSLFDDVYFPRLSWREAMRTWSLDIEDDPSLPPFVPFTVAQFWSDWVRSIAQRSPMITGRKLQQIVDPDEELPDEPEDMFWIRLKWQYTDLELTRAFTQFLQAKRPPNSTKRVRSFASQSAWNLPVKPRSALGWLFVQRAHAECGSWNVFLDRYTPEFERIFGGIPDEKELMARRRRAVQIIGWFSQGVMARPR